MDYLDGISCIIVGYRSLDYLKECIESIRRQKGVAFEIVVVDNDSRDGTAHYLNKLDTKNILLDENRGFGAAVNLGAKKAEYKYLFILNPDTTVPPDSLRKLFQFAELRGDFGLIAPALEYPDGRPQISARKLPRRRDFLLSRGSPLYRLGITGEKEAGYIVPDAGDSIEIPAVSATAILIGSLCIWRTSTYAAGSGKGGCPLYLCRRLRLGIPGENRHRKSPFSPSIITIYQC